MESPIGVHEVACTSDPQFTAFAFEQCVDDVQGFSKVGHVRGHSLSDHAVEEVHDADEELLSDEQLHIESS